MILYQNEKKGRANLYADFSGLFSAADWPLVLGLFLQPYRRDLIGIRTVEGTKIGLGPLDSLVEVPPGGSHGRTRRRKRVLRLDLNLQRRPQGRQLLAHDFKTAGRGTRAITGGGPANQEDIFICFEDLPPETVTLIASHLASSDRKDGEREEKINLITNILTRAPKNSSPQPGK
jgi:hypothetical protein